MKSEPINPRGVCSVCGERESVDRCRMCGAYLCKSCRTIELDRTKVEEITVVPLCRACAGRRAGGAGQTDGAVFGLGRVTDMVNRGSAKMPRFRIRLKT